MEQKFASLEAIYFRFFDVRENQDDTLPKEFWVTRQRLSRLRNLALIKTQKVLSTGKAHFLITTFGHKVLQEKTQDVIKIKPTKEIDFSLFEHDVRITMLRALTEKRSKPELWLSDKWLKAGSVLIDGKHRFHFEKDLRPDAFIVNSKKEKIALEFEVARKTKSRIEAKIRMYDEMLDDSYRSLSAHANAEQFKIFDKVWFVTTKAVTARFLQKMIEQHSRHTMSYRVDLFDNIVPENARC